MGKKRPSAEKPVSLRPLKFEEAILSLLKVKPKRKAPKKKGKKSAPE